MVSAIAALSSASAQTRGTLYIIAVGIDRYAALGNTCGPEGKSSCDLRYSGADARELTAALEHRMGPAHKAIVKRVLVNGGTAADAPTSANIIDAFDILKQATEEDTVVIYVAGLSVIEGTSYRLLATNAERLGESFRAATVVPWQIIQEAADRAKGRRILFVDACYAGAAAGAPYANLVAYFAARSDQDALEDPHLGHGLFTYAVIEGLNGAAAGGDKRRITARSLSAYVGKRVPELARVLKTEQTPQYMAGPDDAELVLVE